MSAKLSRQSQWMLATVFKAQEPIFGKDRVTIGPVTFLLNTRAIDYINQQANESAGQFPLPAAKSEGEK